MSRNMEYHSRARHWNHRAKKKASDFGRKYMVFCLTYSLSLFLFSGSVMSDSLRPHGLQHARLPCPSPSPRVGSNSCPLSQWCHPTISSSVTPFTSCLESFPASQSLTHHIRWAKCWSFKASLFPVVELPCDKYQHKTYFNFMNSIKWT